MINLLVFKTASDEIMDILFSEIRKANKNKIFCIVPSDVYPVYKKKYPNISIIDSKQKVFDYKSFDFEILGHRSYDMVYVPSSSPAFRHYEDIFFIIDKIRYKYIVEYDCYGNKRYYPYKNFFQKIMQYVVSLLLVTLFQQIYKLKYVQRGEK